PGGAPRPGSAGARAAFDPPHPQPRAAAALRGAKLPRTATGAAQPGALWAAAPGGRAADPVRGGAALHRARTGGQIRFPGDQRERARRRRDLLPAGRAATGDRAGGGAHTPAAAANIAGATW